MVSVIFAGSFFLHCQPMGRLPKAEATKKAKKAKVEKKEPHHYHLTCKPFALKCQIESKYSLLK
ncbi:hypothetical protein ACFL7E_06365 [Thermodesulfobacteriota bacterium]